MNREWHRKNLLPRNASLEQRLAWHREHQWITVGEAPASWIDPAREAHRFVGGPASHK